MVVGNGKDLKMWLEAEKRQVVSVYNRKAE